MKDENREQEEQYKLDRTKIEVTDRHDKKKSVEYWLSKTPTERIEYLEHLRWLNYGDKVFERLQRVFEVIERK